MNINTVEEFRAALAVGPHAWPGGYPVFFLCSDGGVLSFDAAKQEAERIESAITDHDSTGWRVVASDINWEDPALFCDHTGKRIESAYAEG